MINRMSSPIEDYPPSPNPDAHQFSYPPPNQPQYQQPPPEAFIPPNAGYPPPPGWDPSRAYSWNPSGYPVGPIKTNTNAIVALISALAGIFLPFVGIIASIIGLVLGILSYQQIQHGAERGRGLAISAVVISGFTLICYAIVMITFMCVGLSESSTTW